MTLLEPFRVRAAICRMEGTMRDQRPENDDFFTYNCNDGSTITVSREFKRACPGCGVPKSIADFGFRKMRPDEAHWRDQPMCTSCRKLRPSKPPAAA
jgi:hypothetical protein